MTGVSGSNAVQEETKVVEPSLVVPAEQEAVGTGEQSDTQ